MKNKIILNIFFIFLIVNFLTSGLQSKINNVIVVKVGNSIITSVDVRNEIITTLLLNEKKITQENINNAKSYSVKNLITKRLKRNEIEKFNIKNYNKNDLRKYTDEIANNLKTDTNGLKNIFLDYEVSYDIFIKQHETELLWNSLIFAIYKNQININIIEVETELKDFKNLKEIEYNISEIELSNLSYNKTMLNEILALIEDKGFVLAAKKFSTSPTGQNGGLLGWVTKKSMSKKYLENISTLKINGISEPIFNENSVSIIKINDIKRINKKIKPDKLKKKIVNQKKEEKLQLFSRSHLINLENNTSINFQ